MEIVSLDDIHYDYTLLSVQVELSKADPTFVVGPGGFNPYFATPYETYT